MKEFTLKQMFSIVDGRLSTNIDDVYDILNAATGDDLTTISLPIVMDKIEEIRPLWYHMALTDLNKIKEEIGDDFNVLMKRLDTNINTYKVDSTAYKTNI